MKYTYTALLMKQKDAVATAPKFALFSAPAGEVLKWAAIHRLSQDQPSAIQREPKKARINGIKRFLSIDERNTIPTAVVIAMDKAKATPIDVKSRAADGSYSENGPSNLIQLEIEVSDNGELPGLVLDGQHRLKGISGHDENMPINIVGLLDIDDSEKAFQFLVINNKAAKVSSDHIRGMVAALDVDQIGLNKRLEQAKISFDDNVGSIAVIDRDPDSPFRGLIKWPHNITYAGDTATQAGYISGAAIELAIGYIRSKNISDLEEVQSVNDLFMTIWSTVKEKWPTLFHEGSKLIEKVGIVCLTEFLFNELRTASMNKRSSFNLSEMDEVKPRTEELLELLTEEFWTVDWKSTSYDTRAGRDLVIAALDTIMGNINDGRPWHLKVDMIAAADLPNPD